jgi:hypothetical protein
VTPAEDKKTWSVDQMLIDPAEANDWVAAFHVDLAASAAARDPQLQLVRIDAY